MKREKLLEQVLEHGAVFIRHGRKHDIYENPRTHEYTFKESNLVNCFNFFAGIRYDNQKNNYFSKIGLGIHYYIGLNPYGQFRSMPYYNQFGIAFMFE